LPIAPLVQCVGRPGCCVGENGIKLYSKLPFLCIVKMRPADKTAPVSASFAICIGDHPSIRAQPWVAIRFDGNPLPYSCFDPNPKMLADETKAHPGVLPNQPAVSYRSLCSSTREISLRKAFAQDIGTHSRSKRQHHPTLKGHSWQGEV